MSIERLIDRDEAEALAPTELWNTFVQTLGKLASHELPEATKFFYGISYAQFMAAMKLEDSDPSERLVWAETANDIAVIQQKTLEAGFDALRRHGEFQITIS